MQKISLLKCSEYSNKILKQKIRQSFENIGYDLNRFSQAKVLIKPNLLMPSKPEKAIITHPEFFRAAVQVVKEHNGIPLLVESPAVHSLKKTIQKTGYLDIAETEKVEIANPTETLTIHSDVSKSFKHIEISKAFFDADIILNLPKFKTHGLTYITGAVKNFFGAIPGLQKSKMHIKIPSPPDFTEFLLDLYGAMINGFEKPKTILNLMDAILAQEGEGPGTAGNPIKMNMIIAGTDAVAVDYVAVKVAGLDVEKAMTVLEGFKRDFCVPSADKIKIVGDTIEGLRVAKFSPSKGTILSNMVRWPMTSKTFRNLFIDRPVPGEENCTLCYQCKKICPAGAVGKSDKNQNIPQYDYKKCIRCYCCMEICPEAAIEKRNGRLQWVLRL
ncbi:MAG: DUF362 domain-containing protein [Deltaproteobacteria bacterium]|nr:DUF362 domain-containing protein [Deltaproteobacteria bacterium]